MRAIIVRTISHLGRLPKYSSIGNGVIWGFNQANVAMAYLDELVHRSLAADGSHQ